MKHIEMKNEMELRSPLDMQMSRWRFITYGVVKKKVNHKCEEKMHS